jgi:hypothetical protein
LLDEQLLDNEKDGAAGSSHGATILNQKQLGTKFIIAAPV